MQKDAYTTRKIQSQLDSVEKQLHTLKDHISPSVRTHTSYTYILFASLGTLGDQAEVVYTAHHHFHTAVSELLRRIEVHSKKRSIIFPWIKIDTVSQVKPIAISSLQDSVSSCKNNYFKYGISFDKSFDHAFLEQEINGNVFIQENNTGQKHWNDKAVNDYLLKRVWNRPLHPFQLSDYKDQTVFLFDTVSVLIEQMATIRLEHHSHRNGIRPIRHRERHIDTLIQCGTNHLRDRVQPNGKFDYAIYAAGSRSRTSYNLIRHADAIHSLADGYRWKRTVQQDDPALLEKMKTALDYLLTYKVKKNESTALIEREKTNVLYSLGATAAAIIAIANYQSLTGDDQYLRAAEELANGLLTLQNKSGSFLNITAKQHQAGYDAKAVYSLLRLFQLDNNPKWLEKSKLAFEHFINRRAQPAPNHWLSYAVYEMTCIIPDQRYFAMKLKSIQKRLTDMKGNAAPSPTQLQILLCARKLIDRMQQIQLDHLLRGFDLQSLEDTIHARADQQRIGFFYPEVAMYMKNPSLIAGSFFSRQHGYRVRIDDLQHNISAYYLYAQYYLTDQDRQSLIPS
ncbi:hypothetical protein SFC66_03655 [Terribacillus saccharophilus]|uniref:hypothetical protein n=1 Tax=Terribacillus saccharophilus TaxID=361277 RepID=UPI003982098D